jgi:ketosteroid isomerase-like protein
MDVTRVTYVDSLAFAELSETVAVDGTPLRTPECLTFELTDDGRIRRVEVFTQTRVAV